MMASAAIGVSHLVQSTRAGAQFGYSLLPILILINILKYPFFEAGHRFAVCTKKSLLEGYIGLGKGYFYAFTLVTLLVSGIAMAGITLVTASLIPGITTDIKIMSTIIAFSSILFLWKGNLQSIDIFIKCMMALLVFCSLAALFLSLAKGHSFENTYTSSPWQAIHLPFIIALLGWMPAPIEISVFQSLWHNEKAKKQKISFKAAMIDFHTGYITTSLLAICFLLLGVFTMHSQGMTFSESGSGFANQLIQMYTSTIGNYTRPLIFLAAFTAMFSTTITVLDGYSLCLSKASNEFNLPIKLNKLFFMVFMCSVALTIIWLAPDNLKQLVDYVTITSFLSAPLFAYLNYKLIFSNQIPISHQPGKLYKTIAKVGILSISALALLFMAT